MEDPRMHLLDVLNDQQGRLITMRDAALIELGRAEGRLQFCREMIDFVQFGGETPQTEDAQGEEPAQPLDEFAKSMGLEVIGEPEPLPEDATDKAD